MVPTQVGIYPRYRPTQAPVGTWELRGRLPGKTALSDFFTLCTVTSWPGSAMVTKPIVTKVSTGIAVKDLAIYYRNPASGTGAGNATDVNEVVFVVYGAQ